jgi:hypothetical protein
MIKLARNIAESLRNQPVALALIVINVIFIAAFALTLREVSASATRRDGLLADLMQHCVINKEGTK